MTGINAVIFTGGVEMSNAIELKKQTVVEIADKLKSSVSTVVVDYRGLNVAEVTELRKQLREAGVDFKVYKNTLTSLAAKELGFEGILSYLEGPVSVAFGYDDATAPARILNDFAKNHKKLELKAGIVEGTIYDAAGVTKLASIPSREVLIAQLLGSFKAPLSNLAYLLNAIKEKKESAEQA